MICPKCGNVIDDNETSCKNCGAKVKEININEDNDEGITEQVVAVEQQVVKEQVVKQEVQPTAVQQPITTVSQQTFNQVKSDDLQKQIQNSKSSNGLLLALVIGLIALISTVGGIVLCKKLSSIETVSVKESTNDVSDSTKKIEENSSESSSGTKSDAGNSAGDTETEDEDETGTSTDVSIGTYVFTFPSNYESKINSGMGISVDKTNKVQVVYTAMSNVSYENAVAAKEEYKSYLIQNGFTVSNYNEYTYGSRKWLVFSGILSNMKSMYAITKLGDSATFQSTIFNLGNKTDDELFSELNYVVDNTKTISNSGSGSNANNQQISGGSSDAVSA